MPVNREVTLTSGLLVLAILMGSRTAWAIPSFARQTKLACNACHTQFPELNAFGREFKLNGYVLRNIEGIELKNSGGKKDLDLPIIPMLSMMFQTSLTQTERSQTGLTGTLGRVQNGTVQFPQQVSLFYGGEFTDHIGGFTQFTYTPDAGTFGIDNTDIRFADHTVWILGGHLKTGHTWTGQNRPCRGVRSGTGFLYRVRLSSCKLGVVESLVRQLLGPHLRTWAWWRSRSSIAVVAAVSPRSLPQSSTGRFEVSSVLARS